MGKNTNSLETDEPGTGSIMLQWATRKHSRTLILGQPTPGRHPVRDGMPADDPGMMTCPRTT
ncbi:hypothetical protein [Arthrobacter sp. NyZ413]|uniref:hypothetical protein n=1 Tax=Arthrobacter sp. NyZ413 TaxID=3144669 RepID=UPI003BF7A001